MEQLSIDLSIARSTLLARGPLDPVSIRSRYPHRRQLVPSIRHGWNRSRRSAGPTGADLSRWRDLRRRRLSTSRGPITRSRDSGSSAAASPTNARRSVRRRLGRVARAGGRPRTSPGWTAEDRGDLPRHPGMRPICARGRRRLWRQARSGQQRRYRGRARSRYGASPTGRGSSGGASFATRSQTAPGVGDGAIVVSGDLTPTSDTRRGGDPPAPGNGSAAFSRRPDPPRRTAPARGRPPRRAFRRAARSRRSRRHSAARCRPRRG